MRINTSRGRLPLLSSRQQSIGCKISTRLKQSVVNAFLCHSPLPTSGGIALRLFRCCPPRSTPSEDFVSLSTAWAVLFSDSRLKRQSPNRVNAENRCKNSKKKSNKSKKLSISVDFNNYLAGRLLKCSSSASKASNQSAYFGTVFKPGSDISMKPDADMVMRKLAQNPSFCGLQKLNSLNLHPFCPSQNPRRHFSTV